MPRRKPRLPPPPDLDAPRGELKAWQWAAKQMVDDEVAERYGDFVVWHADAGLNIGRGEGAHIRAMEALHYCDDEEGFKEFRRLYLAWLEPYINESVGAELRAMARRGKGAKRDRYRGKRITSADDLRAAVLSRHKANSKLSFNFVCGEVADDYGYKSAWTVKRAAASLKWPDPTKQPK